MFHNELLILCSTILANFGHFLPIFFSCEPKFLLFAIHLKNIQETVQNLKMEIAILEGKLVKQLSKPKVAAAAELNKEKLLKLKDFIATDSPTP